MFYYKLDENKKAIRCSAEEWSENFGNVDKTVNYDKIDDFEISTVWLGLDHAYCLERNSKPLLFETMIFGLPYDNPVWRYSTWGQAEEGHKKAVKWVKNGCKDDD